jgi:hypothetical protein
MEINYAQPPLASYVKGLLIGARFWPTDPIEQRQAEMQAEMNIQGAIAEFNRRTGWHPFVNSSGAPQTRTFTATDSNGVLELGAGLLSLTSVSMGGQSYVQDIQFWLEPANASYEGEPFTSVLFNGRYGTSMYATPNRISITGVWGRYREWPADAWNEILRKAAIQTLAVINQEQDVASWSEDGFSESYDIVGVITPKDLFTSSTKPFDECVSRYRRVVAF